MICTCCHVDRSSVYPDSRRPYQNQGQKTENNRAQQSDTMDVPSPNNFQLPTPGLALLRFGHTSSAQTSNHWKVETRRRHGQNICGTVPSNAPR